MPCALSLWQMAPNSGEPVHTYEVREDFDGHLFRFFIVVFAIFLGCRQGYACLFALWLCKDWLG